MGGGHRFKCCYCRRVFLSWAAAERHVDHDCKAAATYEADNR